MSQVTTAETAPHQTVAPPIGSRLRGWIGWVPLTLLPFQSIILGAKQRPWVFMWLLAIAIFAGCKWLTWWQERMTGFAAANWKRSAAYLLLWPGMDAQGFFHRTCGKSQTQAREWFAAIAKTITGFALIWAGARVISLDHPMLGGWAGMAGLVLTLHFGTFHLIALMWQRKGLAVKPIMQRPLVSCSLSELWGRRWNQGFRALSHTWVFQPLQRRLGAVAGTMGAFFASGLLHDLVISVPARAGYGLPTAYFLLQAFGVLAERSEAGKRVGLGRGATGWLWTALIAAGPLYALFHPWFVMRVMVPFLNAIAS